MVACVGKLLVHACDIYNKNRRHQTSLAAASLGLEGLIKF